MLFSPLRRAVFDHFLSELRKVTGCVEHMFWFHFCADAILFLSLIVQVTVNVVCFYLNI